MKRIWYLTALAVGLVGVVALLGCGSSSSAKSASDKAPAETTATITIRNFAFVPATLRVKVGTTITVKNEDDTEHTVTALDNSFDTGNIPGGNRATFMVTNAGAIKFHCNIHNYMNGTIQATG